MRKQLLIGLSVALLLLVGSCTLSGVAASGSEPSPAGRSFKMRLGAYQLTVGPTRFRSCPPSMIGSRCEPIGGDPERRYYAVSFHEKTRLAGLWRERQRWIIPLPF